MPHAFQTYSELYATVIDWLAFGRQFDRLGVQAKAVEAFSGTTPAYHCFRAAARDIAYAEKRSADIAAFRLFMQTPAESNAPERFILPTAHDVAVRFVWYVLQPIPVNTTDLTAEAIAETIDKALEGFVFDNEEIERLLARMDREHAVLAGETPRVPSVAVGESDELRVTYEEISLLTVGDDAMPRRDSGTIENDMRRDLKAKRFSPTGDRRRPKRFLYTDVLKWWKPDRFDSIRLPTEPQARRFLDDYHKPGFVRAAEVKKPR